MSVSSDDDDSDTSYTENSNAFFESFPEHMRPDAILSVKEVTREAESSRLKLFEAWDKLREILSVHELTIRKRWSKKTAVKRSELLKEIQPDLPRSHAPEVQTFADSRGGDLRQSRDLFLFPFVNLEDLTLNNGIKFLSLLYYRSHNLPSDFVQFDSDTIHFGIVSGAIRRIYASECTMVCFGDRDTYGKIIGWEQTVDPGVTGWELEYDVGGALPVADGLVILEGQAKLLSFLLKVVSRLLVDHDLNNLVLSSTISVDPPKIPSIDPHFSWESLAKTNTLRPYLNPPSFSITQLDEIVNQNYEVALDHFIDLHTEPSYLSEQLTLYVEHRMEALPSPPASQTLIHNRAVTTLLFDAYMHLAMLNIAKTLLTDVHMVYDTLDVAPRRDSKLPERYESTLQALRVIVIHIERNVRAALPKILCASPPIRSSFSVVYTDSHFGKAHIDITPSPNDPLMSILVTLLHEDQTHLWQLSRLYDRLDKLMITSDQHARITPLVAKLLSQLGTCSDLLRLLDMHRPILEAQSTEVMDEHFRPFLPLVGKLLETHGPGMELNGVAFPASQFIYPKGPKTTDWARRCKEVDARFSTFWVGAHRAVRSHWGEKIYNLGENLLRPALREPVDWDKLVTPISSRRPLPDPAVLIPFGGAQQKTVTDVDISKVSKKKRTGTTTSDQTASESAPDVQPSEPSPISRLDPIPVSARSLKVMKMLFRSAEDDQLNVQAGSILWTEILSTFTQLNFTVVKSRGSIWQFTHPNGNRINVHEPHPIPRLSFWAARRFGRRLERKFGWTADLFILAGTPSD